MHWCWVEGCAGAAVTGLVARKKRRCARERNGKERESVRVCEQDEWIGAMKQHQWHVRDMCVRAAANQKLHLPANHRPIHKQRQMKQIISVRVTKLSSGKQRNTNPGQMTSKVALGMINFPPSTVLADDQLLFQTSFLSFLLKNQFGLWVKEFASRPGS